MALSVTYQMVKDVAQAAKEKAEELKNQPLMDAILKLQGLAFDLQAENGDMKRELDELKREGEDALEYREEAYWSSNPKNPGPFCPTCYGKDAKRVPVHQVNNYRCCSACKSEVKIPGTEAPRASRARDTMGYMQRVNPKEY